jgi:hypothetical protein
VGRSLTEALRARRIVIGSMLQPLLVSGGAAQEAVQHLLVGETRLAGMDDHPVPGLVLVEVEAEAHALLPQSLVDHDHLHAGVDHLPLLGGDVEPLPTLQRRLVRVVIVGLDQPGSVGGQPLDDGVVADA